MEQVILLGASVSYWFSTLPQCINMITCQPMRTTPTQAIVGTWITANTTAQPAADGANQTIITWYVKLLVALHNTHIIFNTTAYAHFCGVIICIN